jgi:diacylglycerol kinase (ATP)
MDCIDWIGQINKSLLLCFSFMGGTNFWGGTKENDCFVAPSFDDRILEVVAVFGSVQMAASRLIRLQHHRIAQCQNVQITILGKWSKFLR